MSKPQLVEPVPGIPIETAVLHQPVTVAGIVLGERTLNESLGKLLKGTNMYWTEDGLLLQNGTKKAIVPSANVAVAILK